MTAPKRISPTIVPGCKIILVGEAPGANEMIDGRPFTGASGQLLRKLCEEAGYEWDKLSLTTVFQERPRDNDLKAFFFKVKAFKALGHDPKGRRKHPTYGYLDPRLDSELSRVVDDIDRSGADIVVALGAIAFWALGFDHKISAHRGVLNKLDLPSGRTVTVIATYHPAAVLREWSYRPIVVADLKKAATGTEDSRTPRIVKIPETVRELRTLLDGMAQAPFVAYDIETESGHIICISFAPSNVEAVVVPFWNKTKPGWHAWSSIDELDVWRLIHKFFSQKRRWLAQNGVYDMTYLRDYEIVPNGDWEDTMLLHHAVYCEQPKSLGFMGSLYVKNEMAWKELRVKRKAGKDVKADE